MEFKSVKNNKQRVLKAAIIASAVIFSGSAFADDDHGHHHGNSVADYMDTCQNLLLVTTIVDPTKPNTNVCVDAPVSLEKAKVVFDMNSDAVDSKGRHTGLRHMFMLGKALQARINAGKMDADDISVIGVLHGNGINLAQTAMMTPVTKMLINNIFALKADGVNINLEVCGVTMHGRGVVNADLYSTDTDKVHVNQGAIGRIIDLEQHKYALIKE